MLTHSEEQIVKDIAKAVLDLPEVDGVRIVHKEGGTWRISATMARYSFSYTLDTELFTREAFPGSYRAHIVGTFRMLLTHGKAD